MQDFITIFLGIMCCILFVILVFKKWKIYEVNKDIENYNKNLRRERDLITEDIHTLNNSKLEKSKELEKITDITKDINAAAYDAFTQYCESLDTNYKLTEEEYDEAIDSLQEAYDEIQKNLMAETDKIRKELEKISSTRAAAMDAQLKEQEVKDKQAFYCPQVPEADLKDAKTLHDIEYKLNNPRILRMLIWQSYYQKPMNQVCANVLGGNTAEKCGIYKITNQKTDLVYIGQAVDIATRWKNHAKAGLGIDTPANNKLYKAMLDNGLESFSFEVLEECSRDQLNEKERFYIQLYQSDKFGYNSNTGINK